MLNIIHKAKDELLRFIDILRSYSLDTVSTVTALAETH